MQRSKQREDYLRRLDRYTQEGVPETVWQKRCLEKAAASSEKTTPKVPAPTHFQGLRIFGPLSLVDSKFAGFLAEACRACSGRFVFQTTKATATILTGIPTEVKYKAISYVWGVVQPLGIYCKCGGRKDVPIADPERFCALLSLASTADDCDGVWLDALSIDQDSHLDKKSQIAAMGDIYEHAGSVLVLLPGADQKLFDNLCVLRESALQQDGMGLMDFNNITPDTFNASHEQIVETFCSSLEAHKQSLNNGSYFQRAWTFQEWALARDVDVTCESMSLDKSMAMLPELKTCVIRAAVRLAIHRRTSSHGGLRCKIRNADLAAFIDDVRALFPQEEIFSSISEVDWDELIVDNMIPFSGVDNQFRLRLIGQERSPEKQFRARLYSMLNAFNLSSRKASFEADLVACWASMCNIRYDYQKDDHGEVALKKVIDAIRGQGVRVYNFQANVKGASAELDLDFLTYAMEQRNLSSTSRTFTFGAPSFTGVADFAQHLRTSLDEKTPVQLAGKGVALRALLGARIDTITAAENIDKVCGELSRIQTGYWDEPRFIATFHNVQDVARANLLATERSELEKYQLVVVSFTEANVALPDEPKEDPEEAARSQQQMVDDYNLLLRLDMAAPPGGHKPVTSVPSTKLAPDVEYLKYAWAMCPKAAMHSSVFVAREGLNGTLVLAKQRSKACSVISYLTGVDKMSGAYLLPIDLEGKLAIPLRSPQRPDIQVAAKGSFYANRNRKCVGRFLLGKIESLAF